MEVHNKTFIFQVNPIKQDYVFVCAAAFYDFLMGEHLVVTIRGKVRRRVIVLMVVWAVLLLVTFSFLAVLEGVFNSNPEGRTVGSLSWVGYIVSQSFNAQSKVNAIEGSWIVPQVNASGGDGYSSAWVGVGGQTDKTLIQVGTEQDVTGTQTNYYAWYELLPAFSVRINELTISPGDTVSASLTLVDADTNVWSIQLSDISNGQTFSLNSIYVSTLSSGEWIVERPTISNQITSLCDFGTVHFSNCQVKMNNVKAPIGNFTYSNIQMTNQQAVLLASASTLSPDGSSFTANYLASS